MDEHMESGSIPEEPGESDAEGDLERGSDLGSPSPGALRQRASMPVSALPPEGQDPEAALESSLEEQIEAAVERRFQKAKDRRLTRLERELEAVKELVALRKATNQGAGAPEANAAEKPERPAARASHVIQPSGGGLPPAPDLRAEYEKRVAALRPGDVAGLMEIKREFRKKGLEVY